MAPEAEPSLSLTVQLSTDKGRTAYTSTALGLDVSIIACVSPGKSRSDGQTLDLGLLTYRKPLHHGSKILPFAIHQPLRKWGWLLTWLGSRRT
jgi:hypothetical protein